MNHLSFLGLLVFAAPLAFPCVCVSAAGSTAKTVASEYSVVFRGTVTERTVLAQRPEMKGRRRYKITFRADEYWKGSAERKIVLFGADYGTDCDGDGGYEVGKNYLIYASVAEVKDVFLENGLFGCGWSDILPGGTRMLVVDSACTPGGETASSAVRTSLRELGRGHFPSKKTNQ